MNFQMIDVFGASPFTGNPLAVVAGAADLDTETMQRITRWLNLSETTFLLPPPPRRPTIASASSRWSGNFPSPAIRRSARAMPGWPMAACRSVTARSCRNAAPG
jgi:hypothetical protein